MHGSPAPRSRWRAVRSSVEPERDATTDRCTGALVRIGRVKCGQYRQFCVCSREWVRDAPCVHWACSARRPRRRPASAARWWAGSRGGSLRRRHPRAARRHPHGIRSPAGLVGGPSAARLAGGCSALEPLAGGLTPIKPITADLDLEPGTDEPTVWRVRRWRVRWPRTVDELLAVIGQ